MILVAHRGNTVGSNPKWENRPDYVANAIECGYDAEVDVWFVNGLLFLGHDSPQYGVTLDFLTYFMNKLWIHCKHVESLSFLSQYRGLNIFYHKDDIAVTTKGYLWTAPGFTLTNRSIAVMPELADKWDISVAVGVCSDYLNIYEHSFSHNDLQ